MALMKKVDSRQSTVDSRSRQRVEPFFESQSDDLSLFFGGDGEFGVGVIMEALAADGHHLVRRLACRANEKDPAEALFIRAVGLSKSGERLLCSMSVARLI